jgi:mannosyltransferase OCH1-like enzyme
MSIPKIIHQIWIGSNKKPDIWMNTWSVDYVNKHKNYDYMLWNDENSKNILNKYPKIKDMFDTEKEYCGKADMLRYLILYEYGGIYIDADSVWINDKDLTELINKTTDNGIFCGIEPGKDWIANSVIGCTKNNNIMLCVINKLEDFHLFYTKLRRRIGVSRMTGPLFFRFIQDRVTVFPSDYFYPIHWEGISDINLHKKTTFPEESYMIQYGYTTNNLKAVL